VRRDEVVRALDRGIGVLPVLVDGVKMPAAADLPADMRPLLERHARPLRNGDWSTDVARIVNDIQKVSPGPPPPPPPPQPPRRVPIVAILVAVAVIAVAVVAGRAGFDRVFKEVTVPSVAGQEYDLARNTLERAGFRVGVVLVTERSNAQGQPFNHVIRTDPPAGTRARRYLTSVTMYISAVLSLGPTDDQPSRMAAGSRMR
jgi:PASTA domain